MGSIFTSLSQLGALARGQNNSLALFENDYANFIAHHDFSLDRMANHHSFSCSTSY